MTPRFDAVTRIVHWLTALLCLILLVTGTVLYVGPLSAKVGRRELLKDAHVASGLLLFVPLLVGVALGSAGRGLRDDLNELNHWTARDRRWLRRRTRTAPAGKFNGGQKLATALFGGLLAMQLLTGSVMFWNKPFADDLRTGATFVHDWAYLALIALVVGHILKAAQEPELLKAMRTGSVPTEWASRERPGWSAVPVGEASADGGEPVADAGGALHLEPVGPTGQLGGGGVLVGEADVEDGPG
ncbi:MAG: formate dehydrogenase subunit gamma [Acidimicrobiaceae bacterium]